MQLHGNVKFAGGLRKSKVLPPATQSKFVLLSFPESCFITWPGSSLRGANGMVISIGSKFAEKYAELSFEDQLLIGVTITNLIYTNKTEYKLFMLAESQL